MPPESSLEDSNPPNPFPDSSSSPSDNSPPSNSIPQGEQFLYYPVRDDQPSANAPQDGQASDSAAGIGVPLPYPPMSVFPYGSMPTAPTIPRPKRTQCKNACTNCQKACKKCDDNRPCQRCIRYGTTDTCVDSKRKERKKGIKRGPYKKRDGKSIAADTEEDESGRSAQGATVPPPPHIPFVGPVGYPHMWGPIPPAAPGGKLEGTGFYQPVLALAPVGGQPHHGGEGGSVSGGSELAHFPVGFYPATVISYPGPFSPFPIPQPHGMSHGFHFAYPPPPGIFAHRFSPMMVAPSHGDQGSTSSSTDAATKNNADPAAESRAGKDTNSGLHINGQVKVADLPPNDAAEKKAD